MVYVDINSTHKIKWLIIFQWEVMVENSKNLPMDMNIIDYRMADSLK